MSIYRTCPQCGANLDPGEQCDCKEKSAVRRESKQADNPRNKSLAYSIGAERKKVNRESRAMA